MIADIERYRQYKKVASGFETNIISRLDLAYSALALLDAEMERTDRHNEYTDKAFPGLLRLIDETKSQFLGFTCFLANMPNE